MSIVPSTPDANANANSKSRNRRNLVTLSKEALAISNRMIQENKDRSENLNEISIFAEKIPAIESDKSCYEIIRQYKARISKARALSKAQGEVLFNNSSFSTSDSSTQFVGDYNSAFSDSNSSIHNSEKKLKISPILNKWENRCWIERRANVREAKEKSRTLRHLPLPLSQSSKDEMDKIHHEELVGNFNLNDVKAVLEKKPYERTNADKKVLFLNVRNLKAFRKMSLFIIQELCQVFKLLVCKTNDVLFRQGDDPSAFFIILSGSVGVRKMKEGSRHEEEMGRMRMGASFGEVALLDDLPRAATVVALEPSKFMIVEKEDYNRIMQFLHNREIEEKYEFLKRIDLCKRLNSEKKYDMCRHLVWRRYKAGDIIVQEGDEAKEIYFIRKGKCRVTRHIIVDDSLARTLDEIPFHHGRGSKLVLSDVFKNRKKTDKEKSDMHYEQVAHVQLTTLGANQVFGHFNSGRRLATVAAETDIECGVLSRSNGKDIMDPKDIAYDVMLENMTPEELTELKTIQEADTRKTETDEELMNKYIDQLAMASWRSYKRNLMKGIICRKNIESNHPFSNKYYKEAGLTKGQWK